MFELAHGWDDIDQRLRKTGLAIEPGTTRWIDLIVAHLEDKHSRIEELEAQIAAIEEYGTEEINEAVALRQQLAKAVEAGIDVGASLTAAISLLERGGKKAAPSNKMFAQMLVDYKASLDHARATLAELKGELK